MTNIFRSKILIFAVCPFMFSGGCFAQASESVQTRDGYFFSVGGMVNHEYRIFDQGVREFIKNCHSNYKVGESCPVPDEYARKIFTIKPGMFLKVFSNSEPTCNGKIEGFSYIAYESIDGFFLNSKCKTDWKMDAVIVISNSKKQLDKVVPGIKVVALEDKKKIDLQTRRVLDYYSGKLSELQFLLSGYKRDNPDLKDTELQDVLLEKFEFNVKTIQSSKLILISGKEKEVRWGPRFMFLGTVDGPLTSLGESNLIQQLNIKGVPYFYIHSQQQGTGVTVFKLAKLNGGTLETVFSEGGFSD